MPKGPNAERDEHRGWWAPHPPFGLHWFAIFCAQICSLKFGNVQKIRKNTFVCKSLEHMGVVISCWLIYILIYFLKFADQRWVLETLEPFCRLFRYALTSENLHRKPTEALSDGTSWSCTPTIFHLLSILLLVVYYNCNNWLLNAVKRIIA